MASKEFYMWRRLFVYFVVAVFSMNIEASDTIVEKLNSLPDERKIDYLRRLSQNEKVDYKYLLQQFNKLEHSKSIKKNRLLLSRIYYYQGILLRDSKNYDIAVQKLMKAKENFFNLKDSVYSCRASYQLAGLHRLKSQYQQALHYYTEAFREAEAISDIEYMAVSAGHLGNIFRRLKDYDSSIIYCSQALRYYELIGNRRGISNILEELGQTYRGKSNYDSSLFYLKKSLQVRDSIGNLKQTINSLNNIVFVYIAMKDWKDAEEYAQRALILSRKINYIKGFIQSNISLGNIFSGRNSFSNALFYYNEALKNSANIDDNKLLADLYISYYQLFNKTGDYKKALAYYKKYTNYHNKIREVEMKENLAISQGYFDFEKQKLEIDKLTQIRNQQELHIKKQKFYNYILSGVTFLTLLFSVLYYMAHRQKFKLNIALNDKNKLLEEANAKLSGSEELLKELNATKDKLFTILAHDLKNPFNVIIGFTELLKLRKHEMEPEKVDHILKLMHDTSTQGFFLLQNLYEWSRYQSNRVQMQQEKFDITGLINENFALIQPAAEQKGIKMIKNISANIFVYADRNMISTAIRNILSNAVKFTRNDGKIFIKIYEKHESVRIEIEDTGTGMNEETLSKIFKADANVSTPGTANEKGTGLGLVITKELIEKNSGIIEVSSEINKGSRFSIILPVMKPVCPESCSI